MSIRRLRRGCGKSGASLIELIIFIVVVSIAVVGVLMILRTTVAKSSDPAIRKQMVAIAEALLEEVELMPFTYCDPDDANVLTAIGTTTGVTGCALAASVEGPTTSPQALEQRGYPISPNTPWDNVWDYRSLSMTGIKDINSSAIGGLEGYSATVSVADVALNNIPQGTAGSPGAAVLITVIVTAPGGDSIRLDGYRTRYAPNSP